MDIAIGLATDTFKMASSFGTFQAFTLCFLGATIGDKLGKTLSSKIAVLGGLILIGIGIKILLEHMA